MELTLREITAPEGYEIAEDVKFTLEDMMEVQKVEMKDARTPEKPETPVTSVPKTGDDPWKPLLLLADCGLSAAALVIICFASAGLLIQELFVKPKMNQQMVERLKEEYAKEDAPEEQPPGQCSGIWINSLLQITGRSIRLFFSRRYRELMHMRSWLS